jgi:acyl carrier protein
METIDVRDQVREFVTRNFYVANPGVFHDNVSLIREGVIDSTGVLELVTWVEDAYKINVPDADMVPANFDSIDAIVAFVVRKRS